MGEFAHCLSNSTTSEAAGATQGAFADGMAVVCCVQRGWPTGLRWHTTWIIEDVADAPRADRWSKKHLAVLMLLLMLYQGQFFLDQLLADDRGSALLILNGRG